MAELYKCIGCGAEIVSEKICTCKECGHKMFPLPYDRKQVLISEIRKFLKGYEIHYIRDDDLIYKDKQKDDLRFPDFNTIQNYVITSKKTEQFFERLEQSINNISKHYHTPFDGVYDVSSANLEERITETDEILLPALKDLGIEKEIVHISVPKMKLEYEEIPNDDLLEKEEELIEKLRQLTEKMRRFIAVNNVYGDSFKFKPEISGYKKDMTDLQILEYENSNVEKIIKKTYIVDIFSDGTDEAKEMAKTIWNAMRALMIVPLLKKRYVYHFDDESVCVNDEYKTKLLEILGVRYSHIDPIIEDEEFLSDLSEQELFDHYYKAILSDTDGVLKVKTDNLIKVGDSERKLNDLIGLNSIKDSISKIKAYANRNKDGDDLNLHMVFYGNPGTGKTEVARIIAGILHENKILPTDKVVETDRSGMIGQYVGETPQKVMNKVFQAMGGVLFVDEAYALVSGSGSGHFDYGHEAVATLIKAMEDYRGKFCVILAGYKNQMQEMLKTNPGFISRIQFTLDFPNYSRDELEQIGKKMLKNRGYSIADNAIKKILDITDIKRKDENFANAREMRNVLDQVIMCQNLRSSSNEDKLIGIVDVNRYIKDNKINLPLDSDDENHILTADEELDQLVGLESVKKIMRKVKAYAKRNSKSPDFNLHMCFNGNPGTGKTEVARILSRILYDCGVLGEAKLVETDAYGLLGTTVGSTAPKTRAKINDALNGVLFIDEAYALTEGKTSAGAINYGSEAIAVLLKEMEDKRGQFCTILAGYKEEMDRMIRSNPGFASRIQFSVDFPDYSREELGQIAVKMLNKKGYRIADDALSRILDITDQERKLPNYANARNIRNILDQVILNQNLRSEEENVPESDQIILEDVEEYIEEKGMNIPRGETQTLNPSVISLTELKNEYRDFGIDLNVDYTLQTVVSLSGDDSQSTAFIISKEGLCLTCEHCIKGDGLTQKARISFLLANGKMIHTHSSFSVLGKDETNDVALIKLDEEMEYPYLPLAEESFEYSPLKEFVMAGYPFGGESFENASFTQGKIASINRFENRDVVFADMFGKPGSSGSPIIDREIKKVIGIYWGTINQISAGEKIHCFTPIRTIWQTLYASGGMK